MENIRIDIKIRNRGNLLANADVSILTKDFGWVSIKDFAIWKSKIKNSRLNDEINIQPLSVNVNNKWFKKIFFEDSSGWEKIEKAIYEACQNYINADPTPNSEEELEIPF